MRCASVKIQKPIFASMALINLFLAGCAHELGPRFEPARVARVLGLANCRVTQPMGRYETLDYADLVGNPNLENSPEWNGAMSMMQPGDDLRYVDCPSGDNYFALFRGRSLLLNIGGGMLY
jgi:hypothetical protein